MKFVFFGTDEFALAVLAELRRHDLIPVLIITTPDNPGRRGRPPVPPPVKRWAEQWKIPYRQPANLNNEVETLNAGYNLFLIASYGKIIPPEILSIPKHGALNIHPSLLPKYRGPSPIQSAILAGEAETGVTIMLMDEEIDHGPILAAQNVKIKAQNYVELRNELAISGAQLLAEIIDKWMRGDIKAIPQDHSRATFTKKITTADGLIDLNDESALNYRKFLALHPDPGIYFFDQSDRRLKITAAHLDPGISAGGGASNQFIIDRVIPAGHKEMSYQDFRRGQRDNVRHRMSNI